MPRAASAQRRVDTAIDDHEGIGAIQKAQAGGLKLRTKNRGEKTSLHQLHNAVDSTMTFSPCARILPYPPRRSSPAGTRSQALRAGAGKRPVSVSLAHILRERTSRRWAARTRSHPPLCGWSDSVAVLGNLAPSTCGRASCESRPPPSPFCRYCGSARRPLPALIFPLQLRDAPLELADFLAQLGQAAQVRQFLQVTLERACGRAPHRFSGMHDFRCQHAASRAEDGASFDPRLVADPYLAADHGVILDHDAA